MGERDSLWASFYWDFVRCTAITNENDWDSSRSCCCPLPCRTTAGAPQYGSDRRGKFPRFLQRSLSYSLTVYKETSTVLTLSCSDLPVQPCPVEPRHGWLGSLSLTTTYTVLYLTCIITHDFTIPRASPAHVRREAESSASRQGMHYKLQGLTQHTLTHTFLV